MSKSVLMFGINEIIELEAGQYRAIGRVRNIEGDRLHIAFESGYLPWIDEPVTVRRTGDPHGETIDARIVHASGSTCLIEVLEIMASASSDKLLPLRDTQTDELDRR